MLSNLPRPHAGRGKLSGELPLDHLSEWAGEAGHLRPEIVNHCSSAEGKSL